MKPLDSLEESCQNHAADGLGTLGAAVQCCTAPCLEGADQGLHKSPGIKNPAEDLLPCFLLALQTQHHFKGRPVFKTYAQTIPGRMKMEAHNPSSMHNIAKPSMHIRSCIQLNNMSLHPRTKPGVTSWSSKLPVTVTVGNMRQGKNSLWFRA